MSICPPINLINVDAIAFEDANGMWFGQCIQFDISAHAESLPKLSRALEKKIAANVCLNEKAGRSGLEGIPAAPEKYLEAFRHGEIGLSASHKMKSISGSKTFHIHDLKVVEEVV